MHPILRIPNTLYSTEILKFRKGKQLPNLHFSLNHEKVIRTSSSFSSGKMLDHIWTRAFMQNVIHMDAVAD